MTVLYVAGHDWRNSTDELGVLGSPTLQLHNWHHRQLRKGKWKTAKQEMSYFRKECLITEAKYWGAQRPCTHHQFGISPRWKRSGYADCVGASGCISHTFSLLLPARYRRTFIHNQIHNKLHRFARLNTKQNIFPDHCKKKRTGIPYFHTLPSQYIKITQAQEVHTRAVIMTLPNTPIPS